MKKTLYSLCISALMLTACSSNPLPEGILDKQQMTDFLREAYLLESYCAVETRYNFDSLTPEMIYAYDDLLAEQGIPREQVEASLAYYVKHPEEYTAIHEAVVASLESQE